MRPAIKRPIASPAFDVGLVIAAHGRRSLQGGNRTGIYLTVMVVGPLQLDNHVLVGGVVADAPDEATAGDSFTLEGCELDRTAIFDIDRFSGSGRGQ